MPGFPLKMESSPNFKNFRGVTLADINQDGSDEILVASYKKNERLYWRWQFAVAKKTLAEQLFIRLQ